jgi:2-polyprenyl-6-methoxyphenol hydroxylase-like FAD-dependent oxidoreductase
VRTKSHRLIFGPSVLPVRAQVGQDGIISWVYNPNKFLFVNINFHNLKSHLQTRQRTLEHIISLASSFISNLQELLQTSELSAYRTVIAKSPSKKSISHYTMAIPRIAIIGAGPGGLMLARILQHNGMKCTIFELDQDRHSREQGGMLDLHDDMGQPALREGGLLEEFKKHANPGAEAMKLVRSDGSVPWDDNVTAGPSRNHPEIDRTKLRDILLDSVQPNSIQWGKKLVRAEPSKEPKRYDLHFADGVERGFDLVVGADGAWSKIRPLLTDEKPFYSGVSMLDMKAIEVSTKNPWLLKFAGAGSMFMFDEGRMVITQHNGNDTIRTYAGVRQPENWIKDCGIDWTQQDLARKALTEQYFSDCHEDLKRVIAESSDGLIPRQLYMLPIGMKWAPRSGVTLLGDAAHLMTPAGGVGVNVALTDALDLAQALLKRKDAFESDVSGNIYAALQEYEGPMFERAKENAERTAMGLELHCKAEGIDQRISMLQRRARMAEARKRELEQKKSEAEVREEVVAV